ncbi:hypothetical protein J437_LFUL013665 [Ladona fulva]|uniref:Mos1 transposase HTH domain-containing protein n=1 Tax=Ladona fulva TaxID=123851 RepID=A0A8K0KHX2_LADFU|nr:hypothetical protein J437_LFUL013665 [Ladona fulva]
MTAKNETAVEIHRQISSVYGKYAISDQMVRRWRTMSIEGRETVHDEERSGRPMTSPRSVIAQSFANPRQRAAVFSPSNGATAGKFAMRCVWPPTLLPRPCSQ